MGYFILSTRDEHPIRNYKYSGSDNSLLYRFVLTPMNEFIMEYMMPTWIAPNLITTCGFVCCIAASILTAVYSPTLTEELPWFVPAFCGAAIFVYQTLDNLDGKQARKTGSSSPLGLLFDHGCDVTSLTIIYLVS
jgi:ethanolaminephosphotransferase